MTVDTIQILHVDLCSGTLVTNQPWHWEWTLWLPTNLGTGSGSQNKGEPSYQRQSRVGSVTGLLQLLSHFSHVRLCDPMDSSPPGSSVHRILQARILEWVAISFSNACMHAKSLQSCPTLCDPHGQQPSRLLCPRDSLGKNTGVGCHFLLQHTIFLISTLLNYFL